MWGIKSCVKECNSHSCKQIMSALEWDNVWIIWCNRFDHGCNIVVGGGNCGCALLLLLLLDNNENRATCFIFFVR